MKTFLSFLLGMAVGATAAYYRDSFMAGFRGVDYHVQRVVSHYPNTSGRTHTELAVYTRGTSGHVMKVLCLFPPGFTLEGGPESRSLPDMILKPGEEFEWTGIQRVRILNEGVSFSSGTLGYYCEPLPGSPAPGLPGLR